MGLTVRNFGGALIDAITTTRAPLATDNIYKIGQIWVDEAADKFYILTDITAGVATWSGGGGGSGTYYTCTDPGNPTAATMVATTDLVHSVLHGLPAGTQVQFTGAGLPPEIVALTTYYVINPTVNDYQISATSGGLKIDFSVNGNGSYATVDFATNTAVIDANDGVVITTSGPGVPQILETPTTADKVFGVVNAAASLGNITIFNGTNPTILEPGTGQRYYWDGAAWDLLASIDAAEVTFVPYKTLTGENVNDALKELEDKSSTPIPAFVVTQSTTGPGRVSVVTTAVTGVGTTFTTTFKVGDTITVTTTSGVETKAITTITTDLAMVTAAFAGTATNMTYTLAGGEVFRANGNGDVSVRRLKITPTAVPGAPATGIWAFGQLVCDSVGIIWSCTTAGTPGTWKKINDGNPIYTVANLAAAEALTLAANDNSPWIYVTTLDTIYHYNGACTTTRTGTDVLDTGTGGNTRWLGIAGKYIANVSTMQFDTNPTVGAFSEGKAYYNKDWKCLEVESDTDVSLSVGQEEWRRVYNNTGSIILNGKAVYTLGVIYDASDGKATVEVALAKADNSVTANLLGTATQDIQNGSYGMITVRGHINDLNTLGCASVLRQSIYLRSKIAGLAGNAYTLTIINSGSGGLTYTEALGAIIIDLGAAVPASTAQDVVTMMAGSAFVDAIVKGVASTVIATAAVTSFDGGIVWAAGDILYLSDTKAGSYTNVAPSAPSLKVRVGRLIVKDATAGRINIRILTYSRMTDLTDVVISSPVANDVPTWNGISWVNSPKTTVSGSAGIDFYNATPVINSRPSPAGLNQAGTAGNGIKVNRLSKTPVTVVSSVVTISIGAGATITWAAHGLPLLAPIKFTNVGGALPTGITAGTQYYIATASYAAGSFQISTSATGTPSVTTSGSQSGVHTCTAIDLTIQAITGTVAGEVRAYSAWLYDTALGRTLLDGGSWEFSTYAGVNSASGSRSTVITSNIYQVVPASAGSVTVTGSAANVRIATITSGQFTGTYYAASPTNTLGSWLQIISGLTTGGIYQILQGYIFTVTAATAAAGDTYTNNGQTFTVVAAIAGGTTLICTGTGAPAASGNLARATGAGTNPIVFSTYALANTTDVVYLAVPTGYSNDSAQPFNIWNKLFGATSQPVTAITPAYSLITALSAQPAFTVALTDKLGRISFLSNTGSTDAVTLTTGFNGTTYATKLRTPLITLHNNLAGLNVGDYQHLSAAQLAYFIGILSAPVVTAVAYDITTNYATTNTIEYRGLGAAITNQALPASNVAAGQAFVARSLTLINADPTYSVTLIPDAGQSDTADETVLLPGESFVFRLVLLDKKWKLV